MKLSSLEAGLVHTFTDTFNKYISHLCGGPALGRGWGGQHGAPGLCGLAVPGRAGVGHRSAQNRARQQEQQTPTDGVRAPDISGLGSCKQLSGPQGWGFPREESQRPKHPKDPTLAPLSGSDTPLPDDPFCPPSGWTNRCCDPEWRRHLHSRKEIRPGPSSRGTLCL